MGTKKGQRRKTARRAYKGWEITKKGSRRGAKRVVALAGAKFKSKRVAKMWAKRVAQKNRGSNPRVRRVK